MNERDDVGASSIIPSHPIHIEYVWNLLQPHPSPCFDLHLLRLKFGNLTPIRFHDRCAKNMKIGRKPPLRQILIFSGVTLSDTPGSGVEGIEGLFVACETDRFLKWTMNMYR